MPLVSILRIAVFIGVYVAVGFSEKPLQARFKAREGVDSGIGVRLFIGHSRAFSEEMGILYVCPLCIYKFYVHFIPKIADTKFFLPLSIVFM